MSTVTILAVLSDCLVISKSFKGSIYQWHITDFKVINFASKNKLNCLTTCVLGTIRAMYHFLWKKNKSGSFCLSIYSSISLGIVLLSFKVAHLSLYLLTTS